MEEFQDLNLYRMLQDEPLNAVYHERLYVPFSYIGHLNNILDELGMSPTTIPHMGSIRYFVSHMCRWSGLNTVADRTLFTRNK